MLTALIGAFAGPLVLTDAGATAFDAGRLAEMRVRMGFGTALAILAVLIFAAFAATGRDGFRADGRFAGFRALSLAGLRRAGVARRVETLLAAAFLARVVALARGRLAAARALERDWPVLAARTGLRLVALAGFRLAIATSFR